MQLKDAVGAPCDLRVVCDHHDCMSLVCKRSQQVEDRARVAAVQIPGGLVAKYHRRCLNDGSRDRYALTLTARQVANWERRSMLHPYRSKSQAGSLPPLAAVDRHVQSGHGDVVESVAVRKEVERLKNEADVASPESRQLGVSHFTRRTPIEDVGAGCGAIQKAKDVEERCLPRT